MRATVARAVNTLSSGVGTGFVSIPVKKSSESTNAASRRILEGCGFDRDGEIVHAGLRHLLVRLDGPAAAD